MQLKLLYNKTPKTKVKKHGRLRENYLHIKKGRMSGFPGGTVVKNPPAKNTKRIRLPMQGTRVRALVQEDPTCHGATKPVCHNY